MKFLTTKHPHAPLAHHKPVKPGVKIKHVMLFDTGDGAFTDASVKCKPHKSDPSKLVLKCVDPARLLAALKAMNVVPVQILKGKKHCIAIIWKHALAEAMLAGVVENGFSLNSESKQANTLPAQKLALTKGGKS